MDRWRRVVFRKHRHRTLVEAHLGYPGRGCLGLELAVAALLLAAAGRWVVGEHQLIERLARLKDCLVRGLHHHAGFGLEDARSLQRALADVHHADTADGDWSLVLLVA